MNKHALIFLLMSAVSASPAASDTFSYEFEKLTESGKFIGCSVSVHAIMSNVRNPGQEIGIAGSISHIFADKTPMTLVKLKGFDAAKMKINIPVGIPLRYVSVETDRDLSKVLRSSAPCSDGYFCVVYGDLPNESFMSFAKSLSQIVPGKFDSDLRISFTPPNGGMDLGFSVSKTASSSKSNQIELYKFNQCQVEVMRKAFNLD